ncbi:beta-glucoside-specific PTS transporter subunit IIABC [Actinomyces bowdenii]|uniref:PTS glucose transporter subunit IIA n=1 Tax=Actinomyces bowdenii TaxID=131109 RepID=A0A853EHN8_9ACTO|nr:beta-glucoside-specific PTS transporter subunit IIABC [Actinomyces bowdenii]MBF0696022.1 PTS glucose transporter subunit IIA [Actinomyces bowdenii]NYS68195.1 PTS glucose transporter subunit IIA [Actinomyces bowdenii]
MARIDYAALAPQLLDRIGGPGNVRSASHCATRLRLVLIDESKARTQEIKALPGVVTVVQAGGQYQVVIGNDVPVVYEELARLANLGGAAPEEGAGQRKRLFDRFISMVSALINPIVWTLAGAGLIKAFLTLATTTGWLAEGTSTHTILNVAGDSTLYFLPVLLAITSARYFKANEFTAVALAGALLHPELIALHDQGDPVSFLGIPVVLTSYASSLVPIIVAVWVQSHLQRLLTRVLPSAIRNFTVPLLVLLIMVPLTLITVGPVTTAVSNGIASGMNTLFEVAPWLAGAIMGAFWQVFVMFGVHWGLVPIMIAQYDNPGYSLMAGPIFPAVLAQAAATLGVLIRSRNAKLRQLAGPASLSGFLAGITEPAIYGVNLPLKRPFIFGCIGGAVGGVIVSAAGGATTSFVFPSLIGIPALLGHGNLPVVFIGMAVAVAISLTLTLVLGFTDPVEEAPGAAGEALEGAAEPTTQLGSPITGRAVPLERVTDPVFSSGALGNGVGVTPEGGGTIEVLAPAGGRIVTAMDSGHAYGIRTDDGVELLVHIGLDTVDLKGEGFSPAVAAGDRVERGDLLARVDLDVLRGAEKDPTTILVVTNTAALRGVVPVVSGPVDAGQTVVEIDQ